MHFSFPACKVTKKNPKYKRSLFYSEDTSKKNVVHLFILIIHHGRIGLRQKPQNIFTFERISKRKLYLCAVKQKLYAYVTKQKKTYRKEALACIRYFRNRQKKNFPMNTMLMSMLLHGLYLYREVGVWRCHGKSTAYQSVFSFSVFLRIGLNNNNFHNN